MWIGYGLPIKWDAPRSGGGGAEQRLRVGFSGVGALSAAAQQGHQLAASFAGEGTMRVHMFPPTRLTASFNGVGTLTAALAPNTQMAVQFNGVGTLSANIREPVEVSVQFNGVGTLSADLLTEEPVDNTETTTLVNAMDVEPSSSRKQTIDTLITDLKNAGVWSKLDVLYMLAAHDEQASRLNWKDPANGTDVESIIGAPTFTTDEGWQGDGENDALLTGYRPYEQSSLFIPNSCHLGVWVLSDTNPAGGHTDIGSHPSHETEADGDFSFIESRTDGDVRAALNSISVRSAAVPTSAGYSLTSTSITEDEQVIYKDGSLVDTSTFAVTDPSKSPFAMLSMYEAGSGSLFNPSTRQISLAHAGEHLTATDIGNMHTALQTYLQSVGAISP